MSNEIFTQIKEAPQKKLEKAAPLFWSRFEVAHHVVKKNNREIHGRGSRKWIGKSPGLRIAEDLLTLKLRNRARELLLYKPLDCRLWAMLLFYFPRELFLTKKGDISLKLPDLDNLFCLPLDCLQKSGIIKNDSLVSSFDLSRRLISPSGKCELEIFLLPFDEVFENDKRTNPSSSGSCLTS